ncbi:MAG TPA: PIG-L family deacetylase [Sedimentisphaerales bacterium]|nr:PIG-L family deacetylase [Sedimentisphaerales bacterium]
MSKKAEQKKILAIMAHPDDAEITCCGTLALYANSGNVVTIATFTNGCAGVPEKKPQQVAAIRKKEAASSAATIGAKYICCDVDDECVFPNEKQRNIMIDLLRQCDPDIIFTHSPNDYHPDHTYVSQLVFDSYFQKGLACIKGPKVPCCRFGGTQIYYVEPIAGIEFMPSEYVDITSVMDIKRQMLLCHKSQFSTMKDLAKTDMIELIDVQSRFRGFQAGCKHAEGFKRFNAYQRGITTRILP